MLYNSVRILALCAIGASATNGTNTTSNTTSSGNTGGTTTAAATTKAAATKAACPATFTTARRELSAATTTAAAKAASGTTKAAASGGIAVQCLGVQATLMTAAPAGTTAKTTAATTKAAAAATTKAAARQLASHSCPTTYTKADADYVKNVFAIAACGISKDDYGTTASKGSTAADGKKKGSCQNTFVSETAKKNNVLRVSMKCSTKAPAAASDYGAEMTQKGRRLADLVSYWWAISADMQAALKEPGMAAADINRFIGAVAAIDKNAIASAVKIAPTTGVSMSASIAVAVVGDIDVKLGGKKVADFLKDNCDGASAKDWCTAVKAAKDAQAAHNSSGGAASNAVAAFLSASALVLATLL